MMTPFRTAAAVLLFVYIPLVHAESVPTPEKMITEGSFRGIPWISGGVGEGERKYLLDTYSGVYNLKLEFAEAGGNYLADIWVQISKPTGEVVLNGLSDGPWLMTKLPAGTYKVRVKGYGVAFEKTAEVPATGMKTLVFNQWTKKEVTTDAPPAY